MNEGARPELASDAISFLEHDPREQLPLQAEPFQTWTQPDGSAWAYFHRNGPQYIVRFPGMADFEVSADGKTAQAWPAPGTAAATVHHLYLNQVLPLALSRQGRLVLHASAVEIDGQAVAFMAESGRGKSTLAASFAANCGRFLTDDGLQVQWLQGEPFAVPSHPSVRLWEDSRAALLGQEPVSVPSAEYSSKARLLAGPRLSFCKATLRLRRVYLLGSGESAVIAFRPVKPAEAVVAMVSNSFLLDVAAHETLAQHFGDITRIANLPIHYHLDYPRRYEQLPALREAIRRHVANPGLAAAAVASSQS